MMKNFKTLPLVLMIYGSVFSTAALATQSTVSNDSVQDMLRGNESGENENENVDSSSQWGKSARKVNSESITIAKPLEAIEDSSFAVESNRAPASMRGPAAVKAVVAKKALPAPKTMVRTLRQKKAYQEAAVIVNDLGFFPSTLFVTQGIPVRLFVTGASQRSQCMIMDAFGIRRQIRNQKVEEVTFTPDQSGKFSFSCPMNGAKGTIIVKELEINERLPASEPVKTSMVEESDTENSDSQINDSDFGVDYKVKP